MKVYYFYIVRCFDGSFYVGVTNDIERRFNEHFAGVDPNCYTYDRRPLHLEHVSEFQWIEEAIAFEKKVKAWSHRKKRAFIDKDWSAMRSYQRGRDRTR